MRKTKVLIISLVSASILLGTLFTLFFKNTNNAVGGYEYLAKRIQMENPNKIKINFTTLRYELVNYLNTFGDKSQKVSIYYEYLPTGVSININENNQVIGASLMKLPVIMNLYKASELGKIDLNKRVALKKEWLNSDYGELYKKGEGYEITIEEAAKLTLKDSDNTALLVIWDELSKITLDDNNLSLYYLDVEYNVNKDETVSIGARSYSSVLKCLYFSCFNNYENSNKILDYLSKSSFTDRLTKYLPNNLKVSHKIGTFSEQFQSDCGIVYAPKENYILCVMVEGSEEGASNIIAEISRRVYSFSRATLSNE